MEGVGAVTMPLSDIVARANEGDMWKKAHAKANRKLTLIEGLIIQAEAQEQDVSTRALRAVLDEDNRRVGDDG